MTLTENQLENVHILFIEYQKTRKEEIFRQIFLELRDFMDVLVKKFGTGCEEDKYNALVGLFQAIITFDQKFEASYIPQWIIIKVRASFYPYQAKVGKRKVDGCIEDENLLHLELNDSLVEFIKQLYREDLITLSEIHLLRVALIDGLKAPSIIQQYGTTWGSESTVRRNIERLSTLLQCEHRRREL